MLIDQKNITDYIPQRSPFIMIDELKKADSSGFISTFTVRDDNIFLTKNELSESALVENIAQTCAAGFGYLNRNEAGGKNKIGFIGSVSKLAVYHQAFQSNEIETTIQIIADFGGVHLIEGIAQTKTHTLLKCQMKIVLADEQ